jgi:coenzyme F420-reducing hydrogenase alpha subunit
MNTVLSISIAKNAGDDMTTNVEALQIVLTIASDWMETVDPSYAEDVLGLNMQSGEVARAIVHIRQMAQDFEPVLGE